MRLTRDIWDDGNVQLLKQQERQQQQEARTAADLRGAQSPEHAQE